MHRHQRNRYDVREAFYAMNRSVFAPRKNPDLHSNRILISKLSSNMELRKLRRDDDKFVTDKTTSLAVIFLPFSKTKADNIDSYCKLYHKHDLDVLLIQGRFRDVLSPAKERNLSREVLDYLTNNQTPLNVNRFLFHSISSGDYLCALVMNEIKEQPVKYRITKRKISGVVLDGFTLGAPPVPLILLPLPINNNAVIYIWKKLFDLYWLAFGRLRGFHQKVLESFRQEPLNENVLVFHSFGDSASDNQLIDEAIKSWKASRKTDVAVSSWTNSRPGTHIEQHPEQYARAIDSFVAKINLVPHKIVPKNSTNVSV